MALRGALFVVAEATTYKASHIFTETWGVRLRGCDI
jgi:hypothetical protein